MQQQAQQRACTDYRQLWLLFGKIFQGAQCLWTFLDFIKDDQRLSIQCHPAYQPQGLYNAINILVSFKKFAQLWPLVKVEINIALKMGLAQPFHNVCFANLPRALNNQWQPPRLFLPLQ